MPYSDQEFRDIQRQQVIQEQQDQLNINRDNRSIFRDGAGQMQDPDEDIAKDWMTRHSGETFVNIVEQLVKQKEIISGLIRLTHRQNEKTTQLIDDTIGISNAQVNMENNIIKMNGQMIIMDQRLTETIKNLEKFKKMAVWHDKFSKDVISKLNNNKDMISELQNSHSSLLATQAANESRYSPISSVELVRRGGSNIHRTNKKSKRRSNIRRTNKKSNRRTNIRRTNIRRTNKKSKRRTKRR